MLKVYIAAPYSRKDDAEELACEVQREKGLMVISRWHRLSPHRTNPRNDWCCNMVDLENADVLIALTDPELGRETYVEIGIHLARERVVIWLPLEPELGRECLSLQQNPLVICAFEPGENYLQKVKRALGSLRCALLTPSPN